MFFDETGRENFTHKGTVSTLCRQNQVTDPYQFKITSIGRAKSEISRVLFDTSKTHSKLISNLRGDLLRAMLRIRIPHRRILRQQVQVSYKYVYISTVMSCTCGRAWMWVNVLALESLLCCDSFPLGNIFFNSWRNEFYAFRNISEILSASKCWWNFEVD